MEEAIASSQMEGASTTRKVAKDMLRKELRPKNRSQQMIVNNYATIKQLVEEKGQVLDLNMLLDIHRSITTNTLDNPEDEADSDRRMISMSLTLLQAAWPTHLHRIQR
ncbi:hypothetical protein [Segatella albensis]|uniref:hypothetical protein n=1 Tax=Segatella albensis TaxID=77768 RepID=UPI000A9ED0D3|nr:hypothetical protein [Segatella albensis]